MATLNNIENMATTYLEKNGWNEWAKYVLMSLEELKRQHAESEDKIEDNHADFVKAINQLEISFTKQMGELTAEIKVLKTKTTQKASLYAALIALATTIAYVIHNIIT